jgi:hypothetical protein
MRSYLRPFRAFVCWAGFVVSVACCTVVASPVASFALIFGDTLLHLREALGRCGLGQGLEARFPLLRRLFDLRRGEFASEL